MIRVTSGSTRRLLTFPAIHPCETIAPATLLTSLINLARNICSYKYKFFPSNKRNAQEAIRLIGFIRVFAEETREEQLDLTDSVVLSFSELYLAFQKVQYLLEDCTREGARLLMLTKSELVANQFRVFFRSVATALDVLPLESIDLPVEVKEHVRLVMSQARRAKFVVEADDEDAIKFVNLILSRIEDGNVPDKGELRRFLGYIGIEKWSLCNKEVKFLESEIGSEWLSKGKREMKLLSSLLGMTTYCRCILFDIVDGEASRHNDYESDGPALTCLNPDDFRCPISLEFMNDPVIISTGQTYDRSSILKWFRSGNPICPKTGEKLINMEVVPNLVLRRIIQQYCSENGIPFADSGNRKRDITVTVSAGSVAAEQAMKMAAGFLAGQLAGGTGEEANRAAYEIRLLSKKNIFNRSCLVEAGTIPDLLKLLRSSDGLTQENAIAALLNLSKHSKSKTQIIENKGLDSIIHVLKNGAKVEARQHASGTLFYIASIDEYRKLIGENREVIPVLIDHIRFGPDRIRKNSMVAIFGLLMHPGNHQRVLSGGAVPILIDTLASEREDLLTDSIAILATLAEKPDGTAAILRSGALDSVVGLLSSSSFTSRVGKEYCVSLLVALCINGGENVVAVLAKSCPLMTSLYSLISEGTSRAGKKASGLIRILHRFHERRSSDSVAHVLPQERFVHVW